MSPELPKINFEDRDIKALEINGPLTEEQKEQIEETLGEWGWGKFILCSDREDETKYLIVSGIANHETLWNVIEIEYPGAILDDAGFYDTRWGTHLIHSHSSTLIRTPLINLKQINESRAFLRETLEINVKDASI